MQWIRSWVQSTRTWTRSWVRWSLYMVKKYMGWLPPPGYETFYALDSTSAGGSGTCTSPTETPENKELKQVVEMTPSGEVRMKYDDATNTFLYWTDRTIPNYYLDTVARKYVLVYDEKEKYCRPSVEYVAVKAVEIKGPFIQCAQTKPSYQIEKKMNKYKCMGKWKEEVQVEKSNKKISFLEYKNGQMDRHDGDSLYKTE